MIHDYIERLILHLRLIDSNLIDVLVIRTVLQNMDRFIRVISSFMLSHHFLKITFYHVSSVSFAVKLHESWLDSNHKRRY